MIYEAARLQSLDINRVDWFSRRSNRFYSAFQLKSDFSIHPISNRIHPKLATFVGVVTTLWWCSYSDSLLLWLSCRVMRKVSAFLFYLPFDQCLTNVCRYLFDQQFFPVTACLLFSQAAVWLKVWLKNRFEGKQIVQIIHSIGQYE